MVNSYYHKYSQEDQYMCDQLCVLSHNKRMVTILGPRALLWYNHNIFKIHFFPESVFITTIGNMFFQLLCVKVIYFSMFTILSCPNNMKAFCIIITNRILFILTTWLYSSASWIISWQDEYWVPTEILKDSCCPWMILVKLKM